MFSKSKVSQSMLDAVNSVLENKEPAQPVQTQQQEKPVQYILDEAAEKVATPTGMKVYGSSYGNSAKAKRDQTKSSVDTLKGPKDKEMKEELKGDQHKIDANKNDKIDAQDFNILRGKKKVKEEMSFGNKLLETVRKSDIPAYLRKAKGDTPLTVADVKAPKKDSISAPENLAKAKNEWKEEVEVEQIEEKHMTAVDKSEQERIVKGMKKNLSGFKARYGARAKDVMYATATKQAMKEDTVEEEIDPSVRTKDTLKGRKPTTQTDDVGPGSDGKSTKVKFRGGPMKEETVEEATIAGTPGWEKVQKDVKDKSGAVHTPMSRARDLAKQAFKKVKKDLSVK